MVDQDQEEWTLLNHKINLILNICCKSYLVSCARISLSIRLNIIYDKTLKSLVLDYGFTFQTTYDICKTQATEMVSDILDHPV